MSGERFFVTAPGTEVGKTVVTARLVRELRARGRTVEALKPIASGVSGAPGPGLDGSDPGRLLAALGRPVRGPELDEICPWRFPDPLAPDQAAARAGAPPLRLDAVVDFCLAPRAADLLLIEGVGGVRVPIGGKHTVVDWIRAVGAPAVVVSGTYLGSISHLLSALDTLAGAEVAVAGVVLSRSAEEPMPVEDTLEALAPFLAGVPVAVFPRLADPWGVEGPALVEALELSPA